MARNFSINLDEFADALRRAPNTVRRGAREGLDQVKDDWVRAARDIAPKSEGGGNLREQISGDPRAIDDLKVIVTANATERSDGYGRFNYGYWLHEVAPSSTNLTTPGTTLKFLDKSAEERELEWKRWIEEEIQDALEDEGW